MGIYDNPCICSKLKSNTYPGRGIIVGKSLNGKYAVAAYFIMGRSENSRNRVFEWEDDKLVTKPFDESKVEDPSLIIYSAVRKIGDFLIVTNGDQTDTVYDGFAAGNESDSLEFEKALMLREFEPDKPNFTPRISALLDFTDAAYRYKLSILKSADEVGSACNRFTFDYTPVDGVGHYIHTYNHDGNPLPSFTGEPERVKIPNDIDKFSEKIWESLNEENKISLFVSFTDIETQEMKMKIINKNVK